MEHAPHDRCARRVVLDLGGEELAQIKAGTERPRAPRQQHGAVDVAQCADLLEDLGDALIERDGQRIDRRAVNDHRHHLVGLLDNDLAHGFVSLLAHTAAGTNGGSTPSGNGNSCAFSVIATMV